MIRHLPPAAARPLALALLGIALCTSTPRASEEISGLTPEGRPFVRAKRVPLPPRIDGRLDEAAWKTAPAFDDFRQREPDEGAPMTQRTVMKFLFDHDFIYVGVRAYDDPEKIFANTMLRDQPMLYDDGISIRFDTFMDQRNGYTFGVNPIGNKIDALVETGEWRPEWDGIWYVEVKIDELGWVAEFAIPFKTVGFKPGAGRWGFQAVRNIKRNNEFGVLVNPSLNRSIFDMSDLAEIHGLDDIGLGIGLDVKPGFSLQHRRERETQRSNNTGDPSLDVFYRITPGLTAALTFNTDFAEAAVDERQVNLTRFSLFFPEQRDFFLQDERIFSFANRDGENGIPFFSRRIGISPQGEEVDVDAGAKVTGRIGRFNLGALSVQMESHRELDRRNLSVGRLKVNVLEESTMGVIATHGDPSSNDDNGLLGFDYNYRNSRFLEDRTLEANLWWMNSWSEGASDDEASFGGRLAYPNDRVNFSLEAVELQENFKPALGFVNRVAIRQYDSTFRYRLRPQGPVHTFDIALDSGVVTDTSNSLESVKVVFTPMDIANVIGDSVALRFITREERLSEPFEISEGVILPTQRYQFDSGQITLESSRTRLLSGSVTLGWGQFFSGHRFESQGSLRWFLNKHVNVSLDYEQNDVRLDEGDFTTRLARFRLNLQFTPDLSWTSIAQYDNVSDTLGINSRIRWIVEPGNEFFLVLNHGYEVDRSTLRSAASQITGKVTWTFRF